MVEKLDQKTKFITNLISVKKREIQGKMRALDARISALESNLWTLKRTQYTFPNLKMVTLPPNTGMKGKIPNDIIPKNTRAVIVSIKCDQWMETFNAKMALEVKQAGNANGGSVIYTAPLNDFYYETLVPWDGFAGSTIIFKTTGSSKNKYTLGIVGYITQ